MAVKKISILGCGWLGLPLAEAFLEQGFEVRGSTTTPEKLSELAKKKIQPYLIDIHSLEITPENEAFFASEYLVINVPPKRNSGKNYAQPFQNLQKVLANSQVKKVVFVSSTSVYKPSLHEITEESPLEAESAKELIAAENIISDLENGWQTTIIRFAGLFGPGREPGRFLAGKTNLPEPESPVNLIHLQDCIKIIQEIIGQEIWNEVFNACADEHPSREIFYKQAARTLQLQEPTFELKTPGKRPVKLVSNQKLKDALNYEFIFPDPLKAI